MATTKQSKRGRGVRPATWAAPYSKHIKAAYEHWRGHTSAQRARRARRLVPPTNGARLGVHSRQRQGGARESHLWAFVEYLKAHRDADSMTAADAATAFDDWTDRHVREAFGMGKEEFVSELFDLWDKCRVPYNADILGPRARYAIEHPAEFVTDHPLQKFSTFLTLVLLLCRYWEPDPAPLSIEELGRVMEVNASTASRWRSAAATGRFIEPATAAVPNTKAATYRWIGGVPAGFDPPAFPFYTDDEPAPAGGEDDE